MNNIWLRPSGKQHPSGYDIYDLAADAFRLGVCADQLRRVTDPAEQRALFKGFVRRVVIETSSYCNRRCRFCPNADGSRLGARRTLPQEQFIAVVEDLAEIDFDGLILFHLYNEPLANPAIFDEVTLARQKLPNSKLHFNSNGDYIRPGTLARLAEAGLSSLHISIYGPEHGVFDLPYVADRVADMAEICGLPRESAKWLSPLECRATGVFSKDDLRLPVTIQARNFNEVGYDRGALVDIDGIPAQFQRRTPCPSPFDELLLTWNGAAVPCCNIVGDKPEHAAFTIGRLQGRGSIFALYADSPLVDWRRSLLKFADHQGPCAACTRMAKEVDVLDSRHLAFNALADKLLLQAITDGTDKS